MELKPGDWRQPFDSFAKTRFRAPQHKIAARAAATFAGTPGYNPMERSFMRSWRSQTLAVTVALQAIALAQTPRATGPSRIGVLQSLQPEPPVPSDPLELVSGEAQPVQSAEQRQVVTALLQNARALSNVRAQAYDLKTTFTSFGSS